MICLNMMVKNEAPRIERALTSVAPHVDAMAILDTGSTDGTQELIRKFCVDNGILMILKESPFVDFSTSRNEALALAHEGIHHTEPFYILLMDADMELRGAWPRDLKAPVYQLRQAHAGGMSYWNTRLVRSDVDAAYLGVTHEYLSIPDGAGPPIRLEGPWFFDHSDGGNRPGKFARDIALLRAAVGKDPNDSRSWFYLAQSYKDNGDFPAAREAYRTRANMVGTWEEERWRAQLELGKLGDDSELLRAFAQRPTRAEPLYELALRYNETRQYPLAAMTASWGMTIPQPTEDILFVENAPYQWGLRQEFSIAANYHKHDPRVWAMGAQVCDGLSLDRGVPDATRWLGFANYHFYMRPAAAMFPSFRKWRVEYPVPGGWHPMAPSIVRLPDGYAMILRVVNYIAMPNGSHDFVPPPGEPINTRNWLLWLDRNLEVTEGAELAMPKDWPTPPKYGQVCGIEDMRLTAMGGHPGDLIATGNSRELTSEGWCQQIQLHLTRSQMGNWRVISKVPAERNEKNWMPLDRRGGVSYVYLCDPLVVIEPDGNATMPMVPPKIHAERFRGSSQVIPWQDGWLCIIHEVEWRDGLSYYRSRFVEFDWDLTRITRVTQPFFFHHHGIEIATGLAWSHQPGHLVISFSWMDREAWLSTIPAVEIDDALGDPL